MFRLPDLLVQYLTLGIGGVVTMFRPPVLSDFGGGGFDAPIIINALTGNAYIENQGVIVGLAGPGLYAPLASPHFTGEVTAQKVTVTGAVSAGSQILLDSELQVLSSGSDNGAIRGFITTGGTSNGAIRAVEAQASRPAGSLLGVTWGIEVGVHSQVAGSGVSNIGVVVLSSHTGWLPSGVRNDVGVQVAGEDGWLYGYTYFDTDNATVLYSVDQFGRAFAKGGLDLLSRGTLAGSATIMVCGGSGVTHPSTAAQIHCITNQITVPATTAGGGANGFRSLLSTAVAAFTLPTLRHYIAEQTNIGAGSSITEVVGFYAATAAISGKAGTRAAGFYSDVAAAAATWQLFMNGTAVNQLKGGVILDTTAAPTVAAGQVGLGATVATTVGAAGAASALPATPLGYLIINVAGVAAKIPYYNT